MFGNLGQILNLMKNRGQIWQAMQDVNQRLQAARHVGQAGGGQVQATVDGRGELVGIRIDPSLAPGADVELLEELICAALRDAISRSRQQMQQAMQELTGGLNLPGMTDLLSGSVP